ncbi:MAG: hypothetical protein FWH53_01995 [Leptospirales bacterium]|nr:hypothetical protein [Leptospirales bacterium]
MKRKILVSIISIFITTSLFANDLLLETIGAMGGSNIYLTYMSIGVIADSYTKEIYDKEQTVSLITVIERQARVQKDYFEKMMKSNDIPSEEKVFIKKMIECYTFLIDESKYLVEYVNTGKESSAKNFQAKREQAWKIISEILGLNE